MTDRANLLRGLATPSIPHKEAAAAAALDLRLERATELVGFRKAQIAMLQALVDSPNTYWSAAELGRLISGLEFPGQGQVAHPTTEAGEASSESAEQQL